MYLNKIKITISFFLILSVISINKFAFAEIIKPNNGIEPLQVVKIQLRGLAGLLIQVMLFLGRTFPKLHKLFAHVNVLILVLGISATYGSVLDLAGYLLSGDELTRPLATVEQFTAFILCLVGFIMSIQSFINARKN